MKIFSLFCLTIIFSTSNAENLSGISSPSYTPIVLWHGLGDSCCFPFSLGYIKKNIEKALPGVYVHSLKIGKNIPADMENGYFMHPNRQVQLACDLIKSDQFLRNGFNAIGFSQGSQFLRALIQRCPEAQVKNLISLGGQHQGVYGLPDCSGLSSKTCDFIRRMLNHAAYYSWVQKGLAQATYWHDPLNEKMYKKYSTFMAEINNELNINETYKERLTAINKFVMVKFINDSVVQPVDSEWFGFYAPGQAVQILDLRSSSIYQEDRLGLKQMDNDGKLIFLETEGDHLEFSWQWFSENILEPYLGTTE